MNGGPTPVRFLLPDPPLADDVVRLRAPVLHDAAAIAEGQRDPDVRHYARLYPERSWSVKDAERFIAEQPAQRASGDRLALVVTAADDVPVGMLSLLRVDQRRRCAAVGYWLLPAARGRGLAARALGLLAVWSLERTGLVRLELYADVDNGASQRVAERGGFVREKILRANVRRGAEWIDQVRFARAVEAGPHDG